MICEIASRKNDVEAGFLAAPSPSKDSGTTMRRARELSLIKAKRVDRIVVISP
ncbi:MAG: hypothetical protein ISN28_08760 [Ectothiorhodospiraceae bacterium AqS1]|nr:hypothetical protein [Ectothiorhodospiraceae bacterium AqS1]